MADAYLRWKYPDNLLPNTPPVNSDKTRDPPPPKQPSFTTNDLAAAPAPSTDDNSPAPGPTNTDAPGPSTSNSVEITVIDIYTLSTSVKFSCAGDQTTASTLAGLGFIGNAPFHPSVAVSVKTLELYRILRRRKPSFSVEGFVKVISDLYMVSVSFHCLLCCSQFIKVPYRPKYRRLFSDAFDAYLEVIRVVDKRVKVALSHDSPNWRVLNACPACCYEVCPRFWAQFWFMTNFCTA